EAREWQRLIVHRSGLGLLHHAEARRVGFHVRAGELELFQWKVQVLRVNAADGHIPLGDRRSISPRARDDAVTDYLVFHRMQLLHAGDGDDIRATALDLGTHLVEHVAQVDDLRFAGRVI